MTAPMTAVLADLGRAPGARWWEQGRSQGKMKIVGRQRGEIQARLFTQGLRNPFSRNTTINILG